MTNEHERILSVSETAVEKQPVNIASLMRPGTFSEVVGQPYIQGVGRQLAKGYICGQGYMFVGPYGCGKTTGARIVAKALNCEHIDPATGDPCNTCSSCVLANSGAHPLITEINAASSRGINDTREVLSTMNYATPSGYRVYIFDEIHRLTHDAFSLLLKAIEEPPAHTIFMATTTDPDAIPKTIMSRMATIPVAGMTDEDISAVVTHAVETLSKKDPLWETITDKDIESAVLLSQGSARQALTHLGGFIYHGVSTGDFSTATDEIVSALIAGDSGKVTTAVTEALSDKTITPDMVVAGVVVGLSREITRNPDPRMSACLANVVAKSSLMNSGSPAIVASAIIVSCIPQDISPATTQLGAGDGIASDTPTPPKPTPATPAPKAAPTAPSVITEEPKENELHKDNDRVVDDFFYYVERECPWDSYEGGKMWQDILSDPERSNAYYLSDGTLKVIVDREPDEHVRAAVRSFGKRSVVVPYSYTPTNVYTAATRDDDPWGEPEF